MYLIMAVIPKQFQSSESKHTTKHNIVSPNPSLRSKGLAQASPLRLGEGSKRVSGSNAGSHLGETPLAWARFSLAQNKEWVAWATTRVN